MTSKQAPHREPFAPQPTLGRPWLAPVQPEGPVVGAGEPAVALGAGGVVYYSPASGTMGGPWRSLDGGRNFTSIRSPAWEGDLEETVGDTSISVAPGGTLWFSRTPVRDGRGPTSACSSADRGDSWTCTFGAIPESDRSWIVGIDADSAILEALGPGTEIAPGLAGFPVVTYLKTEDRGRSFLPFMTSKDMGYGAGQMVYDAVHDEVWQANKWGDSIYVARIDQGGVPAWHDTGVPSGSTNFANMATRDGRLFLSGEPVGPDQSRSLVVGRSDDGFKWIQAAVPVSARSVAFSAIAAGPDGRIGVAFYGSDRPGAPSDNGGNWSLYAIASLDPFGADPAWSESRLVLAHQGDVCASQGCGEPGTYGRFALDFITAAYDEQGNLHVAYVDDLEAHVQRDFLVRQTAP
jgi:hypothetical protein